ncbi:FeoB-associated Cys-rich membrane protein [Anaerofilum sp. BX8]|uniref:FeoB-associated Cys-rich membrane protein n=1 Tax=Anaerofilum hominis TaxID=2763016 RepID=A0A923I5I8_9FIRM|nr:FeoB-associated Cys-rich membrane protein [Anaerofilum hominis]MBC5580698.1 FeoB-associated Cys-rich membrane protein [Anaerofilum hominis]
MHLIDFVLIGLLALAAALAVRHWTRRRGRGCCGDCAACAARCAGRKRD